MDFEIARVKDSSSNLFQYGMPSVESISGLRQAGYIIVSSFLVFALAGLPACSLLLRNKIASTCAVNFRAMPGSTSTQTLL
jgi:hypothetical protein